MKKIKQFRYYGVDNLKNTPDAIDKNNLITGSIFSKYTPILQLGVQGLPGTSFYINNSPDPIIIGSTGIYELDLNNGVEISSLSFQYESVEEVSINPEAHIIVDVIYEEEEA